MKYFIILYIVVINSCNAQESYRKLVWEENFNDKILNEDVWNLELGDGCPSLCGWGNNECQIYTKKNHFIKDGNLVIQIRKDGNDYTSTKISTKNKKKFQYGKIELRAKLPIGKGLWPAFWMVGSNISEIGWPKCGEIDILEYVGREPNKIFTSIHTQDSYGETINTKNTEIKDVKEGFHSYSIDWTKDKIEFFIDNNSVYTFSPKIKNDNTWPFNHPFYLILNGAVGGNFGGQDIDNTIFPQDFLIDYIRVYQ